MAQQESTATIPFEEIVLDAKYNPALFLKESRFGLDPTTQTLVQRGLDSKETRNIIHRLIIEPESNQSRHIFRERNQKASDYKLARFEICSYCERKTDPSTLLSYFTLAHVDDLLVKEVLKRQNGVLKFVYVWTLESKIKDVRSDKPFVVNGGCLMICVTRCPLCMDCTKIEEISVD